MKSQESRHTHSKTRVDPDPPHMFDPSSSTKPHAFPPRVTHTSTRSTTGHRRPQSSLRVLRPRPRATGGYSTVTGGAKPAKAKAKAPGTRNAFGALG